MWKLLGAVVIFIICATAGSIKVERCKLRLSALSALISDLGCMEANLRYERSMSSGLAHRLSKEGKLNAFWARMHECMKNSMAFKEAWGIARAELSVLSTTELSQMDSFAAKFGTGDIESEIIWLTETMRRLTEIENGLKQEYPSKIKLTGTLSVIGGLAFALLIL